MKTLLPTVAAVLLLATPAHAWWESGHHIVALIAYDLLDEPEQAELLRILEAHPRYAQDFTPNDKIRDVTRWRVGLTGYWPDIARGQPKYNRPTWHYQLASTLTLGQNVNVPETPGPCPTTATLDTKELHIAQAVELCRRVMGDHRQPLGDRAIALTWLAHLAGDAHQPCHAGSLYVAGVYPDGDRGANSIPVVQSKNMHALWDGLLGQRFDEGDVARRLAEIIGNAQTMEAGQAAIKRTDTLNPLIWLEESREFSRQFVYRPEVLGPIQAAADGRAEAVPGIDLSEEYLQQAGALARVRAAEAGYRLAALWRVALAPLLTSD